LDAGDSVALPPSMGVVDFPGVQIVSAADVARQRYPEVFGALVICMEGDATPFDAVRGLINQVRQALHGELVRLIEGGALISDFTASRDRIIAEARAQLGHTMTNLRDAPRPSVIDAIGLWLTSFSDPDDFIGYQAILFAGVDDSLGSVLEAISAPGASVGQFRPGPVDLLLEGDGARYRVVGTVSG
jgi:hypothetical protein